MSFERREQLRHRVVWKAMVTRLNGETLPGSTDNVSREGLNVILPQFLVLGEPVRVNLVTQCRGQRCCFELEGQAVYSLPLEARLGVAVGVRLLEPGNGYQALVSGLD